MLPGTARDAQDGTIRNYGGGMAGLSLSQAAKAAGRSKSTIGRAIKSGRLSATRNKDDTFSIDPAELFRVFPRNSPESASTERGGTDAEQQEIKALRAELETEKALRNAAELLAEERARHIDDLRRMLPPPTAAAPAVADRPARPWWRRLIG